MHRWRHRLLAAASTTALAAGLLTALAAPASADPLALTNFEMRPNAYGTDLLERADDIPMVKATVTQIMGDLNRRRDPADGPAVTTGGACNSDAVESGVSIRRSICFNEGDNETTEWYPQGVTTVADMQSDQRWGDSPQQLIVSWYDHNDLTGGQRGARISFVDRTTGAYRHVLLVYPKRAGDTIDYETVRVSQDSSKKPEYDTALHAGGILWYGDHLFVADTARGFRVFDMRRIYDLGASENGTTADETKIGLIGDTYHAHSYRYIMPQVGSWTRTAATGEKCSGDDGSPNFSYVSLDRSGVDHLLAGEYCDGAKTEADGRVAAWPMAGAFDAAGELMMDTGYRWNANAAYNLPASNIQGATRFNDRWYLTRSRGADSNGTFYTTQPITSATGTLSIASQKPISKGPEDLSHWPGGTPTAPTLGEMWTVAEHPGSDSEGSGPGQRMLYSWAP
ncbi:hypothetical protein [Actinomadura rifamycini]|uniref:hypothetical protein n=1 Tax=Actinomadura rifamycini TaxID=31962 RepID=UPI00041B7065|nr:hypothetical protein [Actinomadura rifamycini]